MSLDPITLTGFQDDIKARTPRKFRGFFFCKDQLQTINKKGTHRRSELNPKSWTV